MNASAVKEKQRFEEASNIVAFGYVCMLVCVCMCVRDPSLCVE